MTWLHSNPSSNGSHPDTARLSGYLDEELDQPERAQVEAHLSRCALCADRLERLRSVDATLRSLPSTTPSAGVYERVFEATQREDEDHERVSREGLGRRAKTSRIRIVDVSAPRDADWSVGATRRGANRRYRPHGMLPTIAALLLMAFTAAVLTRPMWAPSSNVNPVSTATVSPGDALKLASSAIADTARQLAFSPVAPTYLPEGARLNTALVSTTLASNARCLDVTWDLASGPVRRLRLVEAPADANMTAFRSPAHTTQDLAWQVGNSAPWRALTTVEQAGWRGVRQQNQQTQTLLEAEPMPGATLADVDTQLRLVSLSLDAPYTPPQVNVSGPQSGALLRSLATVTDSQGHMWYWDVTLTANAVQQRATITNKDGSVNITDITSSGAGVRLDMRTHQYETLTAPNLSHGPPSRLTEIAYAVNSFLQAGELWNLGIKRVTLGDGRAALVEDLYRVNTARPEHVYVDASTGQVMAIYVDLASPTEPGGPQGEAPFVSTTVCAAYTVTYSWVLFEAPSQAGDVFDSTVQNDWQKGQVRPPFTC